MLSKVITYTDYNGDERTDTCYFNLNKAELMEMELGTTGGYTAYLKRISDARDIPTLAAIFKDLILRSYGVKSDDGKRFIKSQELRDAFEQTEAYSELYMELATNTESAIAFINGVIPKKLAEEVEKASKDGRIPAGLIPNK